jgi:hypothetical protein
VTAPPTMIPTASPRTPFSRINVMNSFIFFDYVSYYMLLKLCSYSVACCYFCIT